MTKYITSIGIAVFLLGFLFNTLLDKDPVIINQVSSTESRLEPKLHTGDNSLPKSLEGITFNAHLSTNESGHLIPTIAIRELFDHYLSTLGETNLENIEYLINKELASNLDEPALSQARSLLKSYISFKIELSNFKSDLKAEREVNKNLWKYAILTQKKLNEFRNQFFTKHEIDAFFEIEDAQTDFLIEQIRINQDEKLTPEEKQTQLEIASLLLPEQVKQSREQAQQYALIRQSINTAKKQGASDEEVFKIRSGRLGRKAAEELALLDQKRQDWNARLHAFSLQRNDILQSNLSSYDKKQSINDLLQSQFKSNEQKRVQAIINGGLLN